MTIPIEVKYVSKHLNADLEYTCPDCGEIMAREDKPHSPLVTCYHSTCPNCGLEYCDYNSQYVGEKPKNASAITEVETR